MAGAVLLLGAVLLICGRSMAAHWNSKVGSGSIHIEEMTAAAAAASGLAIISWWVLSFAAALVAALLNQWGHHRWAAAAAKFSPAFMRRLAVAVLGLNLVGVPLANAAPSETSSASLLVSNSSFIQSQVSSSDAACETSLPAESPSSGAPEESGLRDEAIQDWTVQDKAARDKAARDEAVQAELGETNSPPSVMPEVSPHWKPIPTRRIPAATNAVAEQPFSDPVRESRLESSLLPLPEPHWQPSTPPQSPGLPGQRALRATSEGTAPSFPREVIVTTGDTLWTIAANDLGPLATDVDIALHWPRWHEANRAVIGDDPSRLVPGQVLQRPAPGYSFANSY